MTRIRTPHTALLLDLSPPGMSLKYLFQRWVGDAACVVGDRRGGHRSDSFKNVQALEAGIEETLHHIGSRADCADPCAMPCR